MWLAGFLEGEGYFGPALRGRYSPRIIVVSIDEDVLLRVAAIFEKKPTKQLRSKINPNWKDAYRVCIESKQAGVLMEMLYPYMGRRRREQIDVALGRQHARAA